MVTGVAAVTVLVVMVKVAALAPAVTLTAAGTAAAFVLLLVRITVAPPAGAGADSLIVPVTGVGPTTVVGKTVIPLRAAAGDTMSTAVFATPPYEPEIVTGIAAVTALMVTWNEMDVVPAGTTAL